MIVFLNCWTPHHQRGKSNSKSLPRRENVLTGQYIHSLQHLRPSQHTHPSVSQYIRLCGFRLYAGHELGSTQKDFTTIKTYYINLFFFFIPRHLGSADKTWGRMAIPFPFDFFYAFGVNQLAQTIDETNNYIDTLLNYYLYRLETELNMNRLSM